MVFLFVEFCGVRRQVSHLRSASYGAARREPRKTRGKVLALFGISRRDAKRIRPVGDFDLVFGGTLHEPCHIIAVFCKNFLTFFKIL